MRAKFGYSSLSKDDKVVDSIFIILVYIVTCKNQRINHSIIVTNQYIGMYDADGDLALIIASIIFSYKCYVLIK
jgi:hypothetical protein